MKMLFHYFILTFLWLSVSTVLGGFSLRAQETSVKAVLVNPVKFSAPESYMDPAADVVTDSLVLRSGDTLGMLSAFADSEPPILETGCFYPDLKLVYRNVTYLVSTHCAGIYAFKNEAPFRPGKTRIANDFIFTESLILHLQRLKKNRLGNNSDKFFASLREPSALSLYRRAVSGSPKSEKTFAQNPVKYLPPAVRSEVKPVSFAVPAVKTVSPVKSEVIKEVKNAEIKEVPAPSAAATKEEYEKLFNYPTLIRKITLQRPAGDSLLYVDKTDLKSYVYFSKQNIASHPIIYSGNNEIKFDFDAPTNFKPLKFSFQWKLEGKNEDWSEWAERKTVIVSGLSPQTYRFKVRSKDSEGKISNEASYEFTVLPRWNREGVGGEAPFAVIRRVLLKRGGYDSVLYRNNLILADAAGDVQPEKALSLPYRNPALRFEFARPESDGSKIYQFFMDGLDENWSEWTEKSFTDYSYLAPGSYAFHLRLRQPDGSNSQEAVIKVEVDEPWHHHSLFYGTMAGAFWLLVGLSMTGKTKEKWEGKAIAGGIFFGFALAGELLSHQLHNFQYFDPDITGIFKIVLYGLAGILLALLPMNALLDKLDPKYATRDLKST